MRTLVEEVVVDRVNDGRLKFVIHWKGGTHTAFEMDKPPAVRKNDGIPGKASVSAWA